MARAKHTIAKNLYQLKQDISAVCKAHGGYDPIRWLTTLMQGKDPRNLPSTAYEMIQKIAHDHLDDNRENPLPDEYEWDAIVAEIMKPEYHVAPVPLELSLKAALELPKYLHRNLVDIVKEASEIVSRRIRPRTPEDIKAAHEALIEKRGF
jgi:hypothetical protein